MALDSSGPAAESPYLTFANSDFKVAVDGSQYSCDGKFTDRNGNKYERSTTGSSNSGRNDRPGKTDSGSNSDTWQRQNSEDSNSSDPQGDLGESSATTKPKYPSLKRNGACDSAGSAAHGNGCKPCAFYCYSEGGCRDGSACVFCHQLHESKLRKRKENWKNSHKALQRERVDGRRDRNRRENGGGERRWESGSSQGGPRGPGSDSTCTSHLGSQDLQPMPAGYFPDEGLLGQSMPDLLAQIAGSPNRLKSLRAEGDGVLRNVLKGMQQPTYAADGVQLQSPFRKPGPTFNTEGVSGNRALPKDFAQSVQGSCILPASELGAPPEGVSNEIGSLMRSIANGHGVLDAQAAHADDTMSTKHCNAQMALPAGVVNALTSGRASEIFAYTPNSLVVAVGQKVELRPSRNDSCPRLFAVAPELPRGVAIDKTTGLITGTAQEATDGLVAHFVTSCEPSMIAADIKIQIAIVHINVITVVAPGYTIANLCRKETGDMTLTLRDDTRTSASTSHILPNSVSGPQVEAPHMFAQDFQKQSTGYSQLGTQGHAQQALIAGIQQQLLQEQLLQNASMQPQYVPSPPQPCAQGRQELARLLQLANMQQGYGPNPQQVQAAAEFQEQFMQNANMQSSYSPNARVMQQNLAAQIEAQLLQAVTVLRAMGGNPQPDQ